MSAIFWTRSKEAVGSKDIWAVLGIEPTRDKTAIKAAYLAQLPLHHPEDDPEGFQQLRGAYEAAIEQLQAETERFAPPAPEAAGSPGGPGMPDMPNMPVGFGDGPAVGDEFLRRAGEAVFSYPPEQLKTLDARFQWSTDWRALEARFTPVYVGILRAKIAPESFTNTFEFEQTAWAAFHGGYPAEALALVDGEILRRPENDEVRLLRIRMLFEGGGYDAVVREADAAKNLWARLPDIPVYRAAAAVLAGGASPENTAALESALRGSPFCKAGLSVLMDLHYDSGRYEEALRHAELVLQTGEDAHALSIKGRALGMIGKIAESTEALVWHYSHFPEHFEKYYDFIFLGQFAAMQQHWVDALEFQFAAIEASRAAPDPYEFILDIYNRSYMRFGAALLLQRARENLPASSPGLLARIEKACGNRRDSFYKPLPPVNLPLLVAQQLHHVRSRRNLKKRALVIRIVCIAAFVAVIVLRILLRATD